MKALVTGASGGIGESIAEILAQMGYELILVARNEEKLKEVKSKFTVKADIIATDLSIPENCHKLYEQVQYEDIGILVNNAGYGVFGEFDRTDLDTELNMMNLNITALHILTKLFVEKFKRKNKGYILNVASIAAFFSGPLLSSYYASKSYVMHLSVAIAEELKKSKSKVSISVLCPGPVDTGFNDRAGVKFALKGKDKKDVAMYAVMKMFDKKLLIVPGFTTKIAVFSRRLFSERFLSRICYHMQKRKKT